MHMAFTKVILSKSLYVILTLNTFFVTFTKQRQKY